MQGKYVDAGDIPEDVRAGVAADLADIIYRIEPDEAPLIAAMANGGPPLTKRQQKTLDRLRGKEWELRKEMNRLERKLDTMERRRLVLDAKIAALTPAMSGANRVLTEWLVQELNADHPEEPEGFTVTGP